MIRIEDRMIILETNHTSYIMYADPEGMLRHLYYGRKINTAGDALGALLPSCVNPNGCAVIADAASPALSLDDALLEVSSRGKGDYRDPMIEVIYPDGSRTTDLRYEKAEISIEPYTPEGLPGAYFDDGREHFSLVVTLKEKHRKLSVDLFYTVFEEADVIVRSVRVTNLDNEPVKLERVMSLQLDLRKNALRVTSFRGEWTREMNRFDTLLESGRYVNDSSTGGSSNKANPFIMAAAPGTDEDHGEVIGLNLIYSGNHRESVEIWGHGNARILAGINPDLFSWSLDGGASFDTPEAVLTWSKDGYGGISRNMHQFVRDHIVRGRWQYRERPILINSWEAMYFDVSEKKLLRLAERAKRIGIELFVLDDGWFGVRNDDTSSLGDWYDNKKKLPNGLSGLSSKIKGMGLMFGIWVEPEMISEDSKLFREHPDYAMRIPGRDHSLGRNQMILDLSREEVQDYVIESMSDVFRRCGADYVKWDMNRHMSDIFSSALEPERQGETAHRYMLGLYRVFRELTARFPNILFEGCSSGGNRFDLGMMCYFPQIWTSDCTDPYQRALIQNGASYGYPQSVMGAHVSASPNHQTLRKTSINTRFCIAAGGIFGYELNLIDTKPEDLAEMKEQIKTYKKWRSVLQFGSMYRLGGDVSNDEYRTGADTEHVRWMFVSEDQKKAVGITMQGLNRPNAPHRSFRAKGLALDQQYHFYQQAKKVDIRRMGDLINTQAPVHIRQDSMMHSLAAKVVKLDGEKVDITVSGELLNEAGICLPPAFAGTGMGENTALYQDFDAKMYFMEAKSEGRGKA